MVKFALILSLILAIAIVGNAQRIQRIGTIPANGRIYYASNVTRAGIFKFPNDPSFHTVRAVVITHLPGAEATIARVVRGGIGGSSITLSFKATRQSKVNAFVQLYDGR